MSCLICLDEFESTKSYTCSNYDCNSKLCKECLENLVGFNYGENRIPKCVNTNCNTYFLLKDLKDLDNEHILKYINRSYNIYWNGGF